MGKKVLLIVVAFCLGYLLANVQQQAPQTSMSEQKLVDILVPFQDIPRNVQLYPSMFRKVEMSNLEMSNLVVRDFEEVNGTFSKTDIVADRPVMRYSITQHKPPHIDPFLPPGHRFIILN